MLLVETKNQQKRFLIFTNNVISKEIVKNLEINSFNDLIEICNIKKEVKHIHSYENKNKVNYEPSFLHILSKFLKNYM